MNQDLRELLQSQLLIARDVAYFDWQQFGKLTGQTIEIQTMMTSLLRGARQQITTS